MQVLLIVAIVVATALALTHWFPNATRRWFMRALTARRIIFAVVGFTTALLFIASGATGLVIVGSIMLLFAVLFVIYSDSMGVVRQWLPGV